MASFRLYNIQLLPLDTQTIPEVGIEGYKKLFEKLSETVSAAHKSKTLIERSYKLPHDTYIAPFVIRSKTRYAEGKWVKYQTAQTVVDLYTSKSLFTASEGQAPVSNTYLFRFVYDYEAHRIAVEELGGRLPSPRNLLKALHHLLTPVANQNFPEHTLTINLVSEKKALEQVLSEAKGFKKAEVSITFPNGHEMSKRLRQLKENNVHVMKAEASSEKSALMPSLPDFILDLVRASTEYGKAKLSYITEKIQRRQIFSTEEYPDKIQLRQSKKETDEKFMERVQKKLRFNSGLGSDEIKAKK